MHIIFALVLINVGHTYANAIKTSVNSVEDPLEPRGACGMSGKYFWFADYFKVYDQKYFIARPRKV